MPTGYRGFQKGHPDFVKNRYTGGKGFNFLFCKRGHQKTQQTLVFTKCKNGIRPTDCKKCRSLRVKEFGRSSAYYKRYGITKENWQELFSQQNGCCLICLKHQSELKAILVVDHDHVSGKVRGLLCHACNLIIGNANDDSSVLQRAINYLKSFGGTLPSAL